MKRRPYGRDIGLTIRMGIALFPILLWYLLIMALLLLMVVGVTRDPSWQNLLALGFFGVAGPIALAEQLLKSESIGLRAAQAKLISSDEHAELQSIVARVAAQADLPAPRVAIARSWAPNAFSVGLTERRAVVAFTTELLRRDLTTAELEAVVAHELAHVANRDGIVMTFVSAPALLGSAMWNADDIRGKIFFLLLYWPFFFIGLTAMWTLSRYREYIADRGAALITGAPEQLMSALQKLGGRPPRGDLRGGLAVQALCILPVRQRGWRRFELFADHPPLEKRLERLEELSRELGKAA
ncbi:MAG TPA: M48 family metalloprotease [Gaiellaceae bacterium]|nr:M48 family metalloprotease [Gaiellaceae bacterium]